MPLRLSVAQGYDIGAKYSAIKAYFDNLSKVPAWQKSLPTDGDGVIVEGWKAKFAGN